VRGLLTRISAITLVTSFAYAQSPPLEDREVTARWIKIQTMATAIGDSEGVDHLTGHGMSKEGATRLAAYVREATADYSTWAAGYKDRLCSQAEKLRAGGQEALAQYFEQSRATSASLRRGYLDGVRELLTESDNERLNHLLSGEQHGPKVNFMPNQPNTVTLARTGVMTVESVLKRNKCEGTEGAQQ
jgi:hypothetical protein